MRKHVRAKKAEEIKDDNGKTCFKLPNGDIVKTSKPKPKSRPVALHKSPPNKNARPRVPIAAKLNKSKNVMMKCRKCNKWRKASESLADERFVCISCCDSIMLLAKRSVESLTEKETFV